MHDGKFRTTEGQSEQPQDGHYTADEMRRRRVLRGLIREDC